MPEPKEPKTVRGIDPELFRKVKSQAALDGRPIGELINEALRQYLKRKEV
jgi:hypothetical protein